VESNLLRQSGRSVITQNPTRHRGLQLLAPANQAARQAEYGSTYASGVAAAAIAAAVRTSPK
jgi:hypothetical protein